MQAHSLTLRLLCCAVIFFSPLTKAQQPGQDEVDWPNFQFERIIEGDVTTHITHGGDGSGRLFIIEKVGIISTLQDGRWGTTPFLNIIDNVLNGAERGLFSAAFAPDFKTSGQFYVNYTRRPDGATVVSRFTVGSNTNAVDPSTEQIILLIPQPAPNHNGGQLAFGPDGFLYIGMGDGGGQGDPNSTAQNPLSLLGKMLRIDVSGSSTNYTIPPSNPFVGRTDILPEIWALGLRNPWRFSFDRLTADLFIADVGELREEEINFQPANSPGGENYGWSLYEGTLQFRIPTNTPPLAELTFPVATYPRALGRSITGGHVIRTSPSDRSHGVYIYSDYITGRLGALKQVGTNWHQADFGIYSNAFRRPLQLTSFGEDEQGNLYAAEGGNNIRGIYRVVDRKQVVTPVISNRGTFTNEQSVTLSTFTPGARIHYTIDGTDPSLESPSVASGESIIVAQSGTLRAQGYRSDLEPSPVASANFNLILTVIVDPQTVSVTNGTPLILQASVSNVVIHYTLDGSQPTEASPIFESPIPLDGDQTVRILATRPGWQSAETNFFFGLLIPEWVSIQTYAGGGTPGITEGPARSVHFSRLLALALLPSGDLLTGDLESRTVSKITTNGFVSPLWTNSHPTAFYVNATGTVYTAEFNTIRRAIPDSEPVAHISGDWFRPSGLAVSSDGQAFISASGSAIRARPGLTLLISFPPSSNPIDGAWGVASSTNGTRFWTGAKGIFTFNAQNDREPFAGGHLFEYPSGHSDGPRLSARFAFPALTFDYWHKSLALDMEQNLYVADGNWVRKIDSEGTVRTLLDRAPLESATSLGNVGGIAAHPNGDLFVVDVLSGTIKRISPDSDRDSIPDIDELAPLVLGIDDRSIDTDSDGINNSLEYLAGTDPLDPTSLPSLNATLVEDGIQLLWTGLNPRGDLILEHSQDLTTWSPATNNFSSGSTVVPNQTTPTFFRAKVN